MPKKAYSEQEVEALRIRIMDEASRVMAEEGITNISMRKLSAALGMTAPNLYNYFPSKHELFLQTTLRGFELLEKFITEGINDIDDPRDRFIAVLKSSFLFAKEYAGYWELMFHPPISLRNLEGTPFEEADNIIRKKTFEVMMGLVEKVGEFYPEQESSVAPIRAVTAMTSIYGLIDLYNHRILEQFDVGADDVVDWLIHNSLDLIFPKP